MDNPLVSIVVITYNSSKYILECLDSIYNQTYEKIELIISDDCSKDNTVEICKTWLEANQERFAHTLLITIEKNTGVPSNCNRGVRKCNGEWIKIIAGDDLLLPNALSALINSASANMEAVITQYYSFVKIKETIVRQMLMPKQEIDFFFKGEAHFQLKCLLMQTIVITPGFFCKKSVYNKVGLYDERYPMFEDYPFFVKLTEYGIKLHKINTPCVLYRTNSNSISHSNERVFNTKFKECSFKYHKEVVNNKIKWYNIIYYQRQLLKRIEFKIITQIFDNKRNTKTMLVSKICLLLSFSFYYNKFYIWSKRLCRH